MVQGTQLPGVGCCSLATWLLLCQCLSRQDRQGLVHRARLPTAYLDRSATKSLLQ